MEVGLAGDVVFGQLQDGKIGSPSNWPILQGILPIPLGFAEIPESSPPRQMVDGEIEQLQVLKMMIWGNFSFMEEMIQGISVGVMMNNTCKEEESKSLQTDIFELPGEPAIVINGVPPLPPNNDTLVPCDIVSGAESYRTPGFGEWLKDREVRKLFGDQFYNGKVTEFDRETGWYRVVYEDGDFEDLEWRELEELLLPLDITVPLKALSLKIIRKRQRSTQRSGKTAIKPRNH
ncbi:hypothetical protein U1Q18_013250 [Sarracenia purpurea var. burkii]